MWVLRGVPSWKKICIIVVSVVPSCSLWQSIFDVCFTSLRSYSPNVIMLKKSLIKVTTWRNVDWMSSSRRRSRKCFLAVFIQLNCSKMNIFLGQKCGNRSELKKGEVSNILFPIYIGVNGAVESYSCRLEAANWKTVSRHIGRKKTSVATTLKNITVLEHNLWLGSSCKENISESFFESLPLGGGVVC